MALDASLILGGKAPQLEDPMTIQAKQAKLADLVNSQKISQYQIEDVERGRQDAQTMASLWRDSGGDPAKMQSLMAERGQGARIPAFQQQQAATGKATADAQAVELSNAKKKLDITGAALSSMLADPNVTPELVIGQIQRLVQAGVMPPEKGAELARSLSPDPAKLRSQLLQAGMEVMDANKRIDLLLPKTEIRNLGGVDQAFSTDQVSGKVTPGQTFAKTASPEALLADARARAAQGQAAAQFNQRLAFDREQATNKPPTGAPATAAAKVLDAQEAIAILNQAEPLLKKSTGSGIGFVVDKIAQAFGAATPGAISAQALKVLEGNLVAKMPKMSGPQSDKDVALYRQMAAVIGDETIPYKQKVAALDQVREIQERYAGMTPGSSRPAKPAAPNAPQAPQDGGVVDWGSLK